jgi:hypothetical protein
MERDKVLELGFYEMPYFTIGSSLLFDLGRRRFLSLSSLATPNEILFMYEVNEDNSKQIDDSIVLSNFDYDGYLTLERLSLLLSFFAEKTNKKHYY